MNEKVVVRWEAERKPIVRLLDMETCEEIAELEGSAHPDVGEIIFIDRKVGTGVLRSEFRVVLVRWGVGLRNGEGCPLAEVMVVPMQRYCIDEKDHVAWPDGDRDMVVTGAILSVGPVDELLSPDPREFEEMVKAAAPAFSDELKFVMAVAVAALSLQHEQDFDMGDVVSSVLEAFDMAKWAVKAAKEFGMGKAVWDFIGYMKHGGTRRPDWFPTIRGSAGEGLGNE